MKTLYPIAFLTIFTGCSTYSDLSGLSYEGTWIEVNCAVRKNCGGDLIDFANVYCGGEDTYELYPHDLEGFKTKSQADQENYRWGCYKMLRDPNIRAYYARHPEQFYRAYEGCKIAARCYYKRPLDKGKSTSDPCLNTVMNPVANEIPSETPSDNAREKAKDYKEIQTSILESGIERRDAIINNQPGTFRVAENPHAVGKAPWYEWPAMNDVQKYSFEILESYELHGFDPVRNSENLPKFGENTLDLFIDHARLIGFDIDLVKAIIWMETTHGYYDDIGGDVMPATIRPMNIHANWWRGLGCSRAQLQDPHTNILTGIHILIEIWNRIENPTIEKAATLYNNISADRVSDYGARVQQIYESKPWK